MTFDLEGSELREAYTYLPPETHNWEVVQSGHLFKHLVMTADDGRDLDVFEAGSRENPTILAVNAVGMTSLFLSEIAKKLSSRFHVISWETRGLPDASETEPHENLSLERFAKDAASVLKMADQLNPYGIVTYCSGVNVALYGLTHNILSTDRLCVISPSIELPVDRDETEYQRTMLPIWQDVAARGLSQATLIHRLLEAADTPDHEGVMTQLDVLDKLPFKTPETTYTYALLQSICRNNSVFERIPDIEVPSLILHCCDDEVIHGDTAKSLALMLRNSSIQQIENAGHFGVYTSAELHSLTNSFF